VKYSPCRGPDDGERSIALGSLARTATVGRSEGQDMPIGRRLPARSRETESGTFRRSAPLLGGDHGAPADCEHLQIRIPHGVPNFRFKALRNNLMGVSAGALQPGRPARPYDELTAKGMPWDVVWTDVLCATGRRSRVDLRRRRAEVKTGGEPKPRRRPTVDRSQWHCSGASVRGPVQTGGKQRDFASTHVDLHMTSGWTLGQGATRP
jgi:hypothetical protein